MDSQSTEKRRAGRWWAAGLAVVVMASLVVTAAVLRPWDGDEPPAAAPTPAPAPEPGPVLPVALDTGLLPSAEGIHDAIDELVTGAGDGGEISAAVRDVATGELLYSHQGEQALIPASATKLVTAATVLADPGPAHRLPTTVVAGEERGELVLVGGGDPTLAVDEDAFFPGAARLDDLAEQVEQTLAALGDPPVERLTVDSDLFDGPVHGPWDEHIPHTGYVGPITALMLDGARVDPDPAQRQRASQRHEEPDLAAGQALAELLGLDPDDVTHGSAPVDGPAPEAEPTPEGSPGPDDPDADGAGDDPADATPALAPGTRLGQVHSPPLLTLVEIMLASSDNAVAEALARQVALARGAPLTFEGAAEAMTEVLAEEFGLEVADITIADGSGLSRDNQLTAELLTGLLHHAARDPARPALAGVFSGLPVAGWSGTLETRYYESEEETDADGADDAAGRGDDRADPVLGPAAGMVRAKTGSLNAVNALAGTVTTADGRTLSFALLTEDIPRLPADAREELDEVATALAGCGCP